MKKFLVHIEGPSGNRTITVEAKSYRQAFRDGQVVLGVGEFVRGVEAA